MFSKRFFRKRRNLAAVGVAGALLAAGGVAVAGTVAPTPSAFPSLDGPVYAIAYSGNVVFLGGAFNNVLIANRSEPRHRLAAFNARTGALLAWNPSADNTVRTLAMSGNTLYAGGDFATIGGQPRPRLAGITTSGTVTAFRHTLTGAPVTMAAANGLLYVGGSFSAADGFFRTNAAAFSTSTGRLAAWAPRTNGSVASLATYGGRVYLAGRFTTVGGLTSARHLAAVTTTNGAVDKRFLPHPPQPAYGVTADASGVYSAHGGAGGRLVSYSVWGVPRWSRLFDGDAQAVTTLNGTVYVGGHFDKACATATTVAQRSCPGRSVVRGKMAAFALNGALAAWAPRANGVIGVRTLVASAGIGQLAAGGDFTTINSAVQKRYARFSVPAATQPGRAGSILAYDFDAVTGAASFDDVSNNSHLLTAFTSGGAKLQTVTRQTGRAIKFPARCTGTGCPHLVLQTPNAADLNPGRGPIRFGARVLLATNQTDDGENILQKGYSTTTGQYKMQVDKVAGKPSCTMSAAGDAHIYLVKSTAGMADGQWHTVECRRAGTSLSILVDGTITGTVAIPATLAVSNTLPLVLGAKGLSDNNDQYHGYLDDVWVSRS